MRKSLARARRISEAYIVQLNQAHVFDGAIVTKTEPRRDFYPAAGRCESQRRQIRHTEPEPELNLLLNKLKLDLPAQPPPKITARPPAPPTPL
jgi:hypothetical protein